MTFADNPNSTYGRDRVNNGTPPALAAWSINFSLRRVAASANKDTTDFSRVEFQFQPIAGRPSLKVQVRLKLKLHAAKAGGVCSVR
jgi:hypothetical protein